MARTARMIQSTMPECAGPTTAQNDAASLEAAACSTLANGSPACPSDVYERTLRAREEASAVLAELLAAHAECDQRLRLAGRRVDAVKAVTGQSAIESAIDETRRMIAGIDQALEELRQRGAAKRVIVRSLANW